MKWLLFDSVWTELWNPVAQFATKHKYHYLSSEIKLNFLISNLPKTLGFLLKKMKIIVLWGIGKKELKNLTSQVLLIDSVMSVTHKAVSLKEVKAIDIAE